MAEWPCGGKGEADGDHAMLGEPPPLPLPLPPPLVGPVGPPNPCVGAGAGAAAAEDEEGTMGKRDSSCSIESSAAGAASCGGCGDPDVGAGA